ncbi:diguanylate cyclase [Marinobacter sp.]|uniref:diguanylate cyclase domain-containing protein n=1 Tax=Marinobacter sp. TaxID=50741 RepID=UPI0034A071AC
MRLSDFIRVEMESILQEWEVFAQTILPARDMDTTGLRDHARDMLLAIVDDLDSPQSSSEQVAKSKGFAPQHDDESWAEVHGGARQTSGFSVSETVSEFRALRASVVSLWTKAIGTIGGTHVDDLTRFHESIDQAVAESLEQYATVKEMETRLFSAILRASPDPIYVLDVEGRFIFANKATSDLFALPAQTIVGKTMSELGFPFASDFQRHLQEVVTNQSTYRGELSHTFASGMGERFEYLLAPVLDENKNTEATVVVSRDVTARRLAEEEIWHNAHYDLLTELPNRRLFLDRLEQEVKHAKRDSLPLAVLFMDLDGFKDVNDSLGHEVGDRLLFYVAERLISCVRETDTVARLGGDEFTVILTGANQREEVRLVAQKIIDALAMPFHIAENPIQISASIGITFFPQDAPSPNGLLGAADKAMYKAKRAGSNLIRFYSPSADHPN